MEICPRVTVLVVAVAVVFDLFSRGIAVADERLIASIEKETLWENRDGKSLTWFHPRACAVAEVSTVEPIVLMTMQEIGGSDYFGQVHWTSTADNGQTWS